MCVGREGGARHSFVNVAGSLGHLWSYKAEHISYIVSPVPDVQEYKINPEEDRGLIVAMACGLCLKPRRQWTLCSLYNRRKWQEVDGSKDLSWLAEMVLLEALCQWQQKKKKADNISVIIVFFEVLAIDDDSEPCELSANGSKL